MVETSWSVDPDVSVADGEPTEDASLLMSAAEASGGGAHGVVLFLRVAAPNAGRHTRAELHHPIVQWIEHTYNRRRRQRALGKLTRSSSNSPSPLNPPAPQT